MGNRTTDVDNLAGRKAQNTKICGAMAEQRQADGRNENESVPQKFVHLVGYGIPMPGENRGCVHAQSLQNPELPTYSMNSPHF